MDKLTEYAVFETSHKRSTEPLSDQLHSFYPQKLLGYVIEIHKSGNIWVIVDGFLYHWGTMPKFKIGKIIAVCETKLEAATLYKVLRRLDQ